MSPRRKALTIEERNALEREAIQAGKARTFTGLALTGFVEGYMDRELHYRNPKPAKKPQRENSGSEPLGLVR